MGVGSRRQGIHRTCATSRSSAKQTPLLQTATLARPILAAALPVLAPRVPPTLPACTCAWAMAAWETNCRSHSRPSNASPAAVAASTAAAAARSARLAGPLATAPALLPSAAAPAAAGWPARAAATPGEAAGPLLCTSKPPSSLLLSSSWMASVNSSSLPAAACSKTWVGRVVLLTPDCHISVTASVATAAAATQRARALYTTGVPEPAPQRVTRAQRPREPPAVLPGAQALRLPGVGALAGTSLPPLRPSTGQFPAATPRFRKCLGREWKPCGGRATNEACHGGSPLSASPAGTSRGFSGHC